MPTALAKPKLAHGIFCTTRRYERKLKRRESRVYVNKVFITVILLYKYILMYQFTLILDALVNQPRVKTLYTYIYIDKPLVKPPIHMGHIMTKCKLKLLERHNNCRYIIDTAAVYSMCC